MKTALIIDDNRTQCSMVSHILEEQLNLDTCNAENGRVALDILNGKQGENIKIIILDLEMPIMDGMETLPILTQKYPHIPVIVVTATENIENAARAIKMGAIDFFSKPVNNSRILSSAKNALKISLLKENAPRPQKTSTNSLLFSDLIGHKHGLSEIIKTSHRAATSTMPILITGETGTGKEMLAQAIHGESMRANHPFIALNCGAIPQNLVESTLFGHEKGAFTDAVSSSLGKFREANNGTIFLDEIGELPLDAQVKLLRVLQQQEIEPVGAGKSIPIDVRIISATNRNLETEVQEGRFREDLYFRLNVLPIEMPPLHKRKEDIEELTHFFMQRFAQQENKQLRGISKDALQKLQSHHWPGNVRELENTINRSLVLADGDILEDHDIAFFSTSMQPAELTHGAIPCLDIDGHLMEFKDIENEVYRFAIQHCDNNIPKAAKKLGIAKSTLYRKMN